MLTLQRAILLSLIFIFGAGTACAQARPKVEQEKAKQGKPKFEVTVSQAATGKKAEQLIKEAEPRGAIRQKFFEEARKCDRLIKDRKLKEAEPLCLTALQLAEQLEPESTSERSGAYESVCDYSQFLSWLGTIIFPPKAFVERFSVLCSE
jgi:hypothetical protein